MTIGSLNFSILSKRSPKFVRLKSTCVFRDEVTNCNASFTAQNNAMSYVGRTIIKVSLFNRNLFKKMLKFCNNLFLLLIVVHFLELTVKIASIARNHDDEATNYNRARVFQVLRLKIKCSFMLYIDDEINICFLEFSILFAGITGKSQINFCLSWKKPIQVASLLKYTGDICDRETCTGEWM